jgi:hypothetical protein
MFGRIPGRLGGTGTLAELLAEDDVTSALNIITQNCFGGRGRSAQIDISVVEVVLGDLFYNTWKDDVHFEP